MLYCFGFKDFLFLLLLVVLFFLFLIRRKRLDFFSFFCTIYFIIFILVPYFLFNNLGFLSKVGANWAYGFESSLDYGDVSFLIVLLFFLIVLFSYAIGKKTLSIKCVNGRFWVFVQRNSQVLGLMFVICGAVSFLLYSTTVGGPISALLNSQFIRSGTMQGSGSLSFFKHFMRLSYLGSFFLFSSVLFELPSRNNRKKITVAYKYLCLFCSLVVSFVIAWAYSGRANLITFILVFFLTSLVCRDLKFSYILKLTFSFIFVCFILVFYRPLILYVSTGNATYLFDISDGYRIVEKVISSFSVAYSSLQLVVSRIDISDIYMGKGFFLSFAELIPKRLFGIDPFYTINASHTELFGFVRDERQYTITVSLISYFIYEFWYFGLIIGAGFVGFLLGFLQKIQDTTDRGSVLFIILLFYMVKMPAYFLNSDPASLVKSEFPYILAFFVVYLFYLLSKLSNINKAMNNDRCI